MLTVTYFVQAIMCKAVLGSRRMKNRNPFHLTGLLARGNASLAPPPVARGACRRILLWRHRFLHSRVFDTLLKRI